jgi:hypothetical protein
MLHIARLISGQVMTGEYIDLFDDVLRYMAKNHCTYSVVIFDSNHYVKAVLTGKFDDEGEYDVDFHEFD